MIALSDEQVAEVVRDATAGGGLARLLSTVSDLEELRKVARPLLDDPAYSRATLRSLLVLVAFPADGSERELTDVAGQLGLSASTTHRYVNTWSAIGVLRQDLRSRRYRRAVLDQGSSGATAVGPRQRWGMPVLARRSTHLGSQRPRAASAVSGCDGLLGRLRAQSDLFHCAPRGQSTGRYGGGRGV